MSTTTLKMIALCAMFIDHIGQFFPETPEWFNWIGRISAPIFIYCVVLGIKHTMNKKKYLIRLYLFSLSMAIINMVLNQLFDYTHFYIWNNFFSSLFVVAVVILLLDNFKAKNLFFFIIWQLSTLILCFVLAEKYEVLRLSDAAGTYYFLGSVFGNILFVEGTFLGVVLGAIFYLTLSNRINLIILYSSFSLCFYMLHLKVNNYGNPVIHTYLFPFADYQWMMVFALPFLLLYNGNRGIGLKYIFYIFYPLHLVILYLLAVSRL
ncbi:TraX family protein [Shouchella clausii]|uniref:TraX family protein n=1 Tax=Shouchella clausii TaxID=79880 RepID=UPI000BA57A70|nr:TraX family protein [Shouchella clausii]PAD16010.1 hypothetical protein CHH73_13805 [Shouchella clausii]